MNCIHLTFLIDSCQWYSANVRPPSSLTICYSYHSRFHQLTNCSTRTDFAYLVLELILYWLWKLGKNQMKTNSMENSTVLNRCGIPVTSSTSSIVSSIVWIDLSTLSASSISSSTSLPSSLSISSAIRLKSRPANHPNTMSKTTFRSSKTTLKPVDNSECSSNHVLASEIDFRWAVDFVLYQVYRPLRTACHL